MDLSGKELVSLISDSSPAPGGGSVSAIAGSLGASLVSMVAALTHEKKEFISARKKMNDIGINAQDLQSKLIRLVEEDTNAFNSILSANRLPDKTPEQKKYKDEEIFKANKYAIDIPLETAKLSLEVIKLSLELVQYGNPNSVTDAGPKRVKYWKKINKNPQKRQIDYVDWIELIKFKETRNYVQRVLENYNVYRYVLEKKPIPMLNFFKDLPLF